MPATFSKIHPLREPDGSIALVPLRDGFAAPRRFTATSDTLRLDVEVAPDGIAACRAVEVRARDGEALTSESLRLPLARLVREALAGSARWYAPDGGDTHSFVGGSSPESRALYAELTKDIRPARRGRPVTDEHLRAVAKLYRRLAAGGGSPTQDIADAMNVGRATAARWVRAARDAGHLGEALRGQPGEFTDENGAKS